MLNPTLKNHICLAMLVALLGAGVAHASDAVALWDGTGATDFATWNSLGPDGAVINSGASVLSNMGNNITVNFAGGSGLSAFQCPAMPSCSWTGGFNAGDALIWTNDGTNGTAPLSLCLTQSVTSAGLLVQADAAGQFTAEVQVMFTDNTLSSIFMVNSNANGDPLFMGLMDLVGPNISAIAFDVINSGSDHDFAVDTLQLQTGQIGVPEPTSILLIGTGVLGLWRRLR